MFDRLFGRAASDVLQVSPRDAWEKYANAVHETMLIDVREQWEFARGHAKGARNIPLSQLARRVNELPKNKDILLICQSGSRSLQAANYIKQRGYERIWNISGGTTVWRMSQQPME
jgi:rhodanese-related sulfurtransferase